MTQRSTEPVAVREWRPGDAPDLALQANDRRVRLNMRDAFPHPYGIEDVERFLARALEKSPPTFLAIECSGRIAGGIGYTVHTDVERVSAEVGYWLGHEYRGRGIGTASARVLEKAGYRCEGTLRQSVSKDGQLLDQWMYAIVRDEWARAAGGA